MPSQREHGRAGVIYMGLTQSGGVSAVATPVTFLTDWTVNKTTDKVEVTAFGDTNKTYVAGLPDATGDFSGWYDNFTAQTYTAAGDGIPRNFYLYPNSLVPTDYFYGSILPDFSAAGGVGAAVSIKASWNAAGPVNRAGF
jgi:hypothetical protein